jgi:hypothetical protein
VALDLRHDHQIRRFVIPIYVKRKFIAWAIFLPVSEVSREFSKCKFLSFFEKRVGEKIDNFSFKEKNYPMYSWP